MNVDFCQENNVDLFKTMPAEETLLLLVNTLIP